MLLMMKDAAEDLGVPTKELKGLEEQIRLLKANNTLSEEISGESKQVQLLKNFLYAV